MLLILSMAVQVHECRYNLARMTIGATDFSTSLYSYNDHANDFNQTQFSIAHDTKVLIPLMQRAVAAAQKTGTELSFLATPWSPPAWMKCAAFEIYIFFFVF